MWLEGDYGCCVYTYFSVFIVATWLTRSLCNSFYNRDYHKRWRCSDPSLPISVSVERVDNASFPTWDRTTWDFPLHPLLTFKVADNDTAGERIGLGGAPGWCEVERQLDHSQKLPDRDPGRVLVLPPAGGRQDAEPELNLEGIRLRYPFAISRKTITGVGQLPGWSRGEYGPTGFTWGGR